MYKSKKTGEIEYSSREIKGKSTVQLKLNKITQKYTVVTIDGNIVTEIPSELRARGVQRRSAGAIFKSTDTELISKASNEFNHMWDEKKIEFGYEISDEVKTTKYSELCIN